MGCTLFFSPGTPLVLGGQVPRKALGLKPSGRVLSSACRPNRRGAEIHENRVPPAPWECTRGQASRRSCRHSPMTEAQPKGGGMGSSFLICGIAPHTRLHAHSPVFALKRPTFGKSKGQRSSPLSYSKTLIQSISIHSTNIY